MSDQSFRINRGLTLNPQSSAPSNPTNGDMYYDSSRGTFVEYINGFWMDQSSKTDVSSASSLTSSNFTASVVQSSMVKLTGSTAGNIHGLAASASAKTILLYNGSSAAQIVKNQSATEGTAANRITTPSSADVTIQAGQSAILVYDITAATWVLVSTSGSGSGSGGTKNYLGTVNNVNGNGDFELGSTSKWSLAHSSLTSNFPSTVGTAGNSFSSAGGAHGGSAASGNLTLSAVTSGKLAGSYSGSYASSAATTAGDMLISDAFTIDTEDQSKVLSFKFYYSPTVNPTNGNFSGTSSNSFGVAIYDVTNAAWIQPAGVYNLVQNSGVGISTGTFQTTSNSTQYQIAVYNVNATSGAITMLFDDFFLGPQIIPSGAVITDWQSFTPTITGTSTAGSITYSTQLGYYRRVGDSFEVQGFISINTVTSSPTGSMAIPIPSGASRDTSKAGSGTVLGKGSFFRNSTTTFFGTGASFNGGTSTQFILEYIDSTGSGAFPTIASGDQFRFHAMLPISGFSSNVDMSNDTDTRVVAFLASRGTPSGTLTTTFSTVNYPTVISDTHNAYSAGTYTVPVTGYYDVAAGITVVPTGGSTSAGQLISIAIEKNGTIYAEDFYRASTATSNAGTAPIAISVTSIFCKAGDTITIASWCNYSTPIFSTLLDAGENFFSVTRRSGPATIAATESVNARYYASSTSISGSLATIVWSTKDYDTHSAMASGIYTIPVSGKYQINSNVAISGTFALNNATDIQIQKNGTAVTQHLVDAGGAIANETASVSDIISCLAGDTIRIQLSCGATGPSIISSNFRNFFSITRVGN